VTLEHIPNLRRDTVEVPCNLKLLIVLLAQDAGRVHDSGQCASGVCSARKSKNVDFIARYIVQRKKSVSAFDVVAQSAAENAARKFVDQITGTDSRIVVDDLLYVV
jgi:hypothetical protein